MSCLQVRFNKTLQSKDSLSSATVPGYLYCCTSSTSINHHRRDDGRTLSENDFLLFTSGHIDVQQKDSSYQAVNSTPAQGYFRLVTAAKRYNNRIIVYRAKEIIGRWEDAALRWSRGGIMNTDLHTHQCCRRSGTLLLKWPWPDAIKCSWEVNRK